MEITFYTDPDTIGDRTREEHHEFIDWAREQIKAEYPSAVVSVYKRSSLTTCAVEFNDDEDDTMRLEDQIEMFCGSLWDRYWNSR